MNRGFGLVLAGGGAKGAYEIGAWEALRSSGLEEKITAVSGTSVGALNAVMFAQRDYDGAKEIWNSIRQEDITPFGENTRALEEAVVEHFPLLKDMFNKIKARVLKYDTLSFDPNKLGEMVRYKEAVCRNISELYSQIFSLNGVFSAKGLRDILYKHINMEKLERGIDAYACAARLDCRELFVPYYFKLNNQGSRNAVVDCCMASSAIYPIFGRVDINGQMYVDGGIVDNVPIAPLYNIGYRRFIVVCLSERQTVDTQLYKDCEIYQVVPSQSMGDDVYTVINFERKVLDSYMERGYNDAMKVFADIDITK